jgi:hypothetical protein
LRIVSLVLFAPAEAKHFDLARWVLWATYQVIAEGRF